MNFEWKMNEDKEPTFDDKVHNLACFEIVLNILRMKAQAGDDDTGEEVQALCAFALECMFGDIDLSDEDFFDSIMKLKDKKVNKFRSSLLKDIGIPGDIIHTSEIGEA